jgi:hypothetical protein
VGYCFGIRSERRLCEEVHLNLAYRWFCRLGLEDPVPEHSTFSKNRHGRFRESGAFRHVFEPVLERCMTEGLVGAEGFAIDASVVKADAARASAVPGHAAEQFAYGPGHASRAVREYLEALEVADRPESARSNISVTDPAAEWTCAPGGPAFFAYWTNYLVDIRAGVIVDVEATSAHRAQEVNATRTMIDRVEERFGIKPGYLIGDTAYGNAATLGWLVNDKQIDPYIPVWTRADAGKASCPTATSPGTSTRTSTAVLRDTGYVASGGPSAARGHTSPTQPPSSTSAEPEEAESTEHTASFSTEWTELRQFELNCLQSLRVVRHLPPRS